MKQSCSPRSRKTWWQLSPRTGGRPRALQDVSPTAASQGLCLQTHLHVAIRKAGKERTSTRYSAKLEANANQTQIMMACLQSSIGIGVQYAPAAAAEPEPEEAPAQIRILIQGA